MAKVAINHEILIWGIERSGKLEAELETKFPKLQDWISGTDVPTFKQLEDLAYKLHVPFGYFFLSSPPKEVFPIPYYRTVKDGDLKKPSPDLIDTVQSMQRRQEWLKDYLIDIGSDKLPFVNSAKIGDDIKAIAQDIRVVLGLSENWAAEHNTWADALTALRKIVDDSGINVVANGVVGNSTNRKLNVDEFRGFVIVDEYAPLIFINNSDCKAAQMFTIAHELAHVWLGSSAAFDLRQLMPADNKMEIACNQVAAEFLIPEQKIKELWAAFPVNDDIYQKIARKFKVSELVVARRALDTKLIKREEFYSFLDRYQCDERRTEPKSNLKIFYPTQGLRIGHRFGLSVVQAVQAGVLLYREAYHLTGLHGKTFEEFSRRITGAKTI